MTESTPSPDEAAEVNSASPPVSSRSTLVKYAPRLLMIVILIFAGWYTARSVSVLVSGTTPTELPPESTPPQLPTLDELLAALPPGGHWSFSGVAWDVQVAQVAAAEVTQRLAALPEDETLPGNDETHEGEAALIELAETSGAQPRREGPFEVYELNSPVLRGTLFTLPRDEGRRVVVARMAFSRQGDQWSVLQATPSSAAAATDQRAHLLPLPDPSYRVCARFDDDGSLRGEMVTLLAEQRDLNAAWQQAGWQLQAVDAGGPADQVMCVRGPEAVLARFFGRTGEHVTAMLLVRIPAANDNGAAP